MSFQSQGQSSRLADAKPLVTLGKWAKDEAPSTQSEASTIPQGNDLPSINIPRGGGAIRGIGEKFSTNPATGTATGSISLPVSPGRSGFTPTLSLSYNSGGGNGPFGLGWSLSLPSVSRKTDLGLPQYHDKEESDIYQITGAEDLVPVLEWREDGEWYRQKPKRRLFESLEYDVYMYRPRIESAYSRIERWTAIQDQSTHWRSITRTNVTTIFGENENSRICHPDNPAHVFQWLASQSYDDKGNATVFQYKVENCDCVDVMAPHEFYRPAQNRFVMRYLKRVKYGNRVSRLVEKINPGSEWMFEVVFDYGDHEKKWPSPQETRAWPMRTDPFSHARSGFEIRTYRLCERVLMFHHFPDEAKVGQNTLVSSLDIGYFESGLVKCSSISSATCASSFIKMSYLRQGNGYVEAAMPPVEMEYSVAAISNETRYIQPSALEGIPIGVQEPRYQFVDLDGEGALGILASQGGAYYYKSNLGGGEFGPPIKLPNVPTLHAGKAKSPQMMDLLGDGHMDMVRFDGLTPGFYKRNIEVGENGWEPWQSFKSLPNLSWNNPNMKFVDLNGDGHADILITEDSIHIMYPSLLEDGFGPPSYWRPPINENHGPRLLLSDRVESLFLADMTGDGLSDFVRIRYHEVCYWPSLGYGRFGHKVCMTNSPLLQRRDLFQQSRIRLADIDGTGTTDILYINGHQTRFYLNQSGNGWTNGFSIPAFPTTNDVTDVQIVDLLSKGTACLVWSSDLAADFGSQVRYVDLMAAGKPYLLVKSRNNLGSETRYTYNSSTKFYLADKARGEPWITKLPFPVQVVERTETFDYISKNRFVSRNVYHNGYYDGLEKEFRGFGMVETWDTEEISTLMSESHDWGHEHTNWDHTTTSPPVVTKAWFHTGAKLRSDSLENLYQIEYYGEFESQKSQSSLLPSKIRVRDGKIIPHELNSDELRQSYRALKGSALHSEIYSCDGTERSILPYTVNHSNFIVEMLQPQSMNQHAVFQTRSFEAIESVHDRQLYHVNDDMIPDPRITQAFTLKTDIYGNVLQSITIHYGRRYPDSSDLLKPQDHEAQSRSYAMYTENLMSNVIDSEDDWLLPVGVESQKYELYNFRESSMSSQIVSFDWIRSVVKKLTTGKFNLPYESYEGPQIGDHHPCRRLLEHSQTLYRRNDLDGPLRLGELESMGFPYMSFQLAITPEQIEQVFVANGKISPEIVSHTLEKLGGYVMGDDGNWWTRTALSYFSREPDDTPAQELEYARHHFFQICRSKDIFSTAENPINAVVTYDKYNLIVQESCDALGNRTTVGERDRDPTKPLVRNGLDYRFLTPWLVMDANRNLTNFAYNVMGMVVGSAVLGKPEAPEGDSLDEFEPNLSEDLVKSYFEAPLEHLHSLLGTASSCVIYDYWAYYRTRREPMPKPVCSSTLSRDTHISQLSKGQESRITVEIAYLDGFVRPVQHKVQAEPGTVSCKSDISHDDNCANNKNEDFCNQRWVGSGWTVYNNKGNPVRQFESFFTKTHEFERDAKAGVSPILLYDPLQRVVATVMPDHTWSKAVMDPWRTVSWDANDLVLAPNPRLDPDVGGYFDLLPRDDYLPTWYDQRKNGQLGRDAQRSALKAAVHANTPGAVFLDTMKHAVVAFETITTQRVDSDKPRVDIARASAIVDIQGNQHGAHDSNGRLVTTARYNYLGGVMIQSGMENGQSWVLNDVLGKAIFFWDSRNQRRRIEYDKLRRPISLYYSIDGGKEVLMEQTKYGEALDDPEAVNSRTKVIEIKDQSGLTATPLYDFKGSLVRSAHQLVKNYRENIDWAREIQLEDAKYEQTLSYDAKSRATQTVTPDGTITRYKFNVRGLEERVVSQIRGEETDTKKHQVTITRMDYDAKGQRALIDYGNGSRTKYTYDPLTFRMTQLRTRLGSGPLLQDLSYTYDSVGNVTYIQDNAQQTIFFRNRRVEPSIDYTYDSGYRLVEVGGREHLGQIKGASSPVPTVPGASDSFNTRLDLPGDSHAMARYVETYCYDKVGNILTVKHRGDDPSHSGWTRKYTYNEASQLEADKVSNRLSATTVGSVTETYHYDGKDGLLGNMTAMPHLTSMQWDYKDQLRSTSRQVVKTGLPEVTWYVYNTTGQRVRKVTERASTEEEANPGILKERIYLGNFEIYRKYNSDGSTVSLERETVHIMDSKQRRFALVETRTQGTESGKVPAQLIRYQFGNHLDSSTLELDEQGQIVSYEEYYPFGSTSYQGVRSQLETPKRYRFTGKERDEENGLYYYGARYYAPWLGRWTSCDPSGMVDGSNLYVYARNNPSGLTDQDGRESGPKWQEVVTNDETSKYYALEGTDEYIRSNAKFTEKYHGDGGDREITFSDVKITGHAPPTTDQILKDSQTLDRASFYLKYKDFFTPQQLLQVMDALPVPPLKLEPENNWTYMGEGGRVGTEDDLAEAQLADDLMNLRPPSEIGVLYGVAATALGGDAKEVARMMKVGDEVNTLVSPVLSMTIMGSAAARRQPPTPPPSPPPPTGPPPSKGPKLPIVDSHSEATKSAQQALQGVSDKVYTKLTNNPALISKYLTPGQRVFASFGGWAQKIVFGNAMEKAIAEATAQTGFLNHTGATPPFKLGGADFEGVAGTPFEGLNFQLTSTGQFQKAVHQSPDDHIFILHPGLKNPVK